MGEFMVLFIFLKIFFWCGPFLKSLLNVLQYCFCFMFWFFGCEVCGILVAWPGLEPTPPALEGKVLTTGPPGKSLWFLLCFFLTSLLEYDCFTMVCQFLLYNKVNQLYIYICPHISSFLHLPPSHPPYPTPLGGHKALSWSPCAMRLLPTSYLFYVW